MLHSLFFFLLENQMFGHQRSAHKCSFLPPRLPKDRPNSEGEKKEKKKKKRSSRSVFKVSYHSAGIVIVLPLYSCLFIDPLHVF